jgi:hypothetical protein
MGNHEYCEACGESDFHHGRPCDPAKKAAMSARTARCEKRKTDAVKRMERTLAQLKIPFELDQYDNAVVSWSDFTRVTSQDS